MDKNCKYREYDEIVAKTLFYVLNLEDEDFKIDYFDEDDIIDLYLFRIMSMAQMYRNRPILLNMNLFHYLKFKYQNRKNQIQFKHIKLNKEHYYDSSFHLYKILAIENKDTMSDLLQLEDTIKEIYKTYYDMKGV